MFPLKNVLPSFFLYGEEIFEEYLSDFSEQLLSLNTTISALVTLHRQPEVSENWETQKVLKIKTKQNPYQTTSLIQDWKVFVPLISTRKCSEQQLCEKWLFLKRNKSCNKASDHMMTAFLTIPGNLDYFLHCRYLHHCTCRRDACSPQPLPLQQLRSFSY